MEIGFISRDGCPLCRSRDAQILCEIPYDDSRLSRFLQDFYRDRVPLKQLSPFQYRVLCCGQCDFIYQDPILDRNGMQALYQDWIDHSQSLNKKQTAQAKLFRQYAAQLHTLSRLFKARPDQTRILDFGMGWGYWGRMAQAHGYNVTGYELSAQRREHACKLGINVVDTLPESTAGFDCIFASQVFEHLPDPLQSLRQLGKCLADDGFIYIRVPDGRQVLRQLTARGWAPDLDAIHPLEHINCFTRKTLIGCADRVGLKPFNPPLRLSWGSLWGGIKREFADRYLTTHIYFRR